MLRFVFYHLASTSLPLPLGFLPGLLLLLLPHIPDFSRTQYLPASSLLTGVQPLLLPDGLVASRAVITGNAVIVLAWPEATDSVLR